MRRMGGLYGQASKAGKVGREGSDVPGSPARSHDVPAAMDDDKESACHGDDFIKRLHGISPEIGADRLLLIIGKIRLIDTVLRRLLAENAVSERIPDAVHRAVRKAAARFLPGACAVGHDFLEPAGNEVGNRREEKDEEGQFPVIIKKERGISDHDDARVEDFRREFAHAFHAGIDVRDDARHEGPFCLARLGRFLMDERAVKDRLHRKGDVVGKMAHVKTLEGAAALHDHDRQKVERSEAQHRRWRPLAAQDVDHVLGQLPFEPGGERHAHIVDEPADRHVQKDLLLSRKVIEKIRRRIFLHNNLLSFLNSSFFSIIIQREAHGFKQYLK